MRFMCDGGAEFALAWSFMLVAQALLGDGAYAVRVPALLPWERGRDARLSLRQVLEGRQAFRHGVSPCRRLRRVAERQLIP